MRSNKNNRAVIVGIVVALGIAIFMIGVFTLGGQKKTFASTFTLRAIFNDVNGIQRGNNIWFSGVKVGTIRSVNFGPHATVIVAMNVEESVREYIHYDSHAKVSSDGLIGNKIIVIYGGSPELPVVKDGDTLSVESLSTTEGMLDTLQLNNKNLLSITGNVKTLSKNLVEGKGTIGQLLTQDEMATTLRATLNTLQQASQNAQALTASLAAFSSKLNQKGNFANSLVTDTVIFKKLGSAVNDLQVVVDNAKKATAQLNDKNNAVGVLLNDPKAAADLRETLRNLNQGTAKLDTNMEALQHNIFLRGFFKKKHKAEEKARENGE